MRAKVSNPQFLHNTHVHDVGNVRMCGLAVVVGDLCIVEERANVGPINFLGITAWFIAHPLGTPPLGPDLLYSVTVNLVR